MSTLLANIDVLAAIGWAPEIRNILAVLVGAGVLVGSVYLLVATNTGIRTGMLVTLAGLFGWMLIMGIIWWIYGIGMLGRSPAWVVEDPNLDLSQVALDDAGDLRRSVVELPDPRDILDDNSDIAEEVIPADNPDRINIVTLGDIIEVAPEVIEEYGIGDTLGDWELLAVSDRQRGDAVAVVDAYLGPDGEGIFESSSDYVVRDAYSTGGKPSRDGDSMIDRIGHELSTWWHWRHPAHYAVVQIQAAVPQEAVPGEAPPSPRLDQSEPVLSVVLVRDLGDKRFPAAMVTIVFGILFAITCNTLHRRDKAVAEARAKTPA